MTSLHLLVGSLKATILLKGLSQGQDIWIPGTILPQIQTAQSKSSSFWDLRLLDCERGWDPVILPSLWVETFPSFLTLGFHVSLARVVTNPAFPFSQDNLNLLLTEEEMYSLTETFQRCKVIPGKAGRCCREGGARNTPSPPFWDEQRVRRGLGGLGGRGERVLVPELWPSEAPTSPTAPLSSPAYGRQNGTRTGTVEAPRVP